MKTVVKNQNAVQNRQAVQNQNEISSIFENSLSFKRVVVSELEYDDNTTGQTMTLYNEETDFEHIVQGLNEGYKSQSQIVSVKHTICEMAEGNVKPFIWYQRVYFSYEEKIIATRGSHFYYIKAKNKEQGACA